MYNQSLCQCKGHCSVVGCLSQNKVRQPVMTAGMGLYTGKWPYPMLSKVQCIRVWSFIYIHGWLSFCQPHGKHGILNWADLMSIHIGLMEYSLLNSQTVYYPPFYFHLSVGDKNWELLRNSCSSILHNEFWCP